MATQPSEEQGNSNHAEQPAGKREKKKIVYGKDFVLTLSPPCIENVRVSVGSAPSQSRGAPEISEEQVDGRDYRPLLQATFKGDWESAERFLVRDSASKTAKITSRSETVLHIAALSAQDQFFEKLVEHLSPYPEALELVDCGGRTALHNAVLCGRIRMVKALVTRNPRLTRIEDNEGRFPLGISALEASMHKEIAWFLAKNTTDDEPSHPFRSPSAIDTIIDLTYAGHHDITLYLFRQYPHLATIKRVDLSILNVLARMGSHFLSGTQLSVLEELIYKCIPVDLNFKPTDKYSNPALQCLARSLWNAAKIKVPIIKRLHEVKLRHVAAVQLAKQVCIEISYMNPTEITDLFEEWDLMYQATAEGNSELVKLFIQFFPELIWTSPHGKRLMTHAVEFRQERTLRLFLKVSSTNKLSLALGPTLEESMRMISAPSEHAAARYHPSFDGVTNVAGAAFQMQRELQWYKAVEKWIIPDVRTAKPDGNTYWEIFVEKHKRLLENGEKWVKETANSCMLVSTLIATVLFAAAFTVPGGNDSNTGAPLLLGKESLLIFVIFDALGLFSSVMAILLFLAILTSRYEPQDFLRSLPKKIIMGLSCLFLSLAFMLVAFAATLTIVLNKRLEWAFIPITLMASLPVVLFIVLQLPLLCQMVKSTCGRSMFRPEGIWDGVQYKETRSVTDESIQNEETRPVTDESIQYNETRSMTDELDSSV